MPFVGQWKDKFLMTYFFPEDMTRDTISGPAKRIVNISPDFLNHLLDTLESIVKDLFDLPNELLDSVGDLSGELTDNVGKLVSTLVAEVGSLVANLVQGIVEGLIKDEMAMSGDVGPVLASVVFGTKTTITIIDTADATVKEVTRLPGGTRNNYAADPMSMLCCLEVSHATYKRPIIIIIIIIIIVVVVVAVVIVSTQMYSVAAVELRYPAMMYPQYSRVQPEEQAFVPGIITEEERGCLVLRFQGLVLNLQSHVFVL
nr:hypothetical protein BaRGS_009945 [Batillaria attramentaria]